jgi:hypothetical protein
LWIGKKKIDIVNQRMERASSLVRREARVLHRSDGLQHEKVLLVTGCVVALGGEG